MYKTFARIRFNLAADDGLGGAGNSGGQSGEDGGASWIPESLKGNASVEKFKSVEDLAKSYVGLETRLGSSVNVPKDDAAKEEWDKFYARIGRPEAPEKYDLTGMSDDIAAQIRKVAFENGMTVKQAKAYADTVLAHQAETSKKATEESQKVRETATAALKSEWGGEFDKNVALANKALSSLLPGALAAITEKGLANDPALVKDLARLGKRLGEDNLIPKTTETPTTPKDKKYAHLNERYGK